jgi:phosphoribosylaminoimidazolecarboxamide formyltransferase/IMP cyclohydrolase
MTIKRALISVSNKAGLLPLARALDAMAVQLYSTGGTAKTIREAGLPVTDVSDLTGFPEILDGRVKTLHPKVHGGILGRRDLDDHKEQMDQHGIKPIDFVVVNLYPFRQALASGADFNTCNENIDICGPAMIRAAAKNHSSVTILTDPSDYEAFIEALTEGKGEISSDLKRFYAGKAYAHTASYDTAISTWLASETNVSFPEELSFTGRKNAELRYGENPHQQAAVYANGDKRPGAINAEIIQGKALSYNNLNDTDAAFESVAEFTVPAVSIIKHANPCGVAMRNNLAEAYRAALACDPVSAFGGIIACNRPLDGETAAEIVKIFTEVIIAPGADAAAQAVIASKPNLRLLLTDGLPDVASPGLNFKSIAGGMLVQNRDTGQLSPDELKIVTKRQPNALEVADMLFAFRVAKHVKSNAIIYAKNGSTVGIGAGQMSRVDSARIAARKAQDAAMDTKGSVVASDAFFPFADGLDAAIDAGATAVIQPGGSMRDQEVIDRADEAGLAMVFTGMRHFRH